MDVLIRTFAPNANANYGGILQAWAMQRAITELGFNAYVDASSWSETSPTGSVDG